MAGNIFSPCRSARPLVTPSLEGFPSTSTRRGFLESSPKALVIQPNLIAPQHASPLLSLPGELRNTIYEYVATEPPSHILIYNDIVIKAKPMIMKTCRQLRSEHRQFDDDAHHYTAATVIAQVVDLNFDALTAFLKETLHDDNHPTNIRIRLKLTDPRQQSAKSINNWLYFAVKERTEYPACKYTVEFNWSTHNVYTAYIRWPLPLVHRVYHDAVLGLSQESLMKGIVDYSHYFTCMHDIVNCMYPKLLRDEQRCGRPMPDHETGHEWKMKLWEEVRGLEPAVDAARERWRVESRRKREDIERWRHGVPPERPTEGMIEGHG